MELVSVDARRTSQGVPACEGRHASRYLGRVKKCFLERGGEVEALGSDGCNYREGREWGKRGRG